MEFYRPSYDYYLTIKGEQLRQHLENGGYYALTYSFLKTAQCTYRQTTVKGKPAQKGCDSLLSINSISLFTTDSLKNKTEKIIAEFDASILETERKSQ